jgi:hypothetical protein
MTQYQSRRERREAEAGLGGELPAQSARPTLAEQTTLPEQTTLAEQPTQLTQFATPPQPPLQDPDPHAGLTRRERRMVAAGETVTQQRTVTPPPSRVLAESLVDSEVEDEAEAALPTGKDLTSADPTTETVFTGSNLLSEPKTQSIVLPVVPELALPSTSTGEIFTTGSISILSEPVEAIITGSLDGIELDRLGAAEAMTGALSVVQPVSALSVIRERESVAVVPTRTLRRGWWQPWLIGAAALVMLVAAVFTTLVILEAISG